jgi:hypothetical protein
MFEFLNTYLTFIGPVDSGPESCAHMASGGLTKAEDKVSHASPNVELFC